MADAPQEAAPQAVAPTAPAETEPTMHPAEIRRLQREARETRKELERLQSEAKTKADAELSEIEKLRKQLAEHEQVRTRHDTLHAFVSDSAAELLASLPEAARTDAQASIEGLEPLAQVKLLKTFAKLAGQTRTEPPKAAPGARGPLAPGKPSTDDLLRDPEAFRRATTPEERRALLQSLTLTSRR